MQSYDLNYLIDRQKIMDLVHLYMKGLDERRWDLLQRVLTSPFHMQAAQLDIDRLLTPEEYIQMGPKKFLSGFDVTSHIVSNDIVTIEGDTAHVEVKLYACHYINEVDDRRDIGGNLTPEVGIHCNKQMPWSAWARRQRDKQWRIERVAMGTHCSEGDTRAFDLSLARSGQRG